jgi:hypothetical protein
VIEPLISDCGPPAGLGVAWRRLGGSSSSSTTRNGHAPTSINNQQAGNSHAIADYLDKWMALISL